MTVIIIRLPIILQVMILFTQTALMEIFNWLEKSLQLVADLKFVTTKHGEQSVGEAGMRLTPVWPVGNLDFNHMV